MEKLSDWLPHEFFQGEYDNCRTFKFADCEVVGDYDGTDPATPAPFKHKYLFNWCIIAKESKLYAVGWNESPSIGWSFPIQRYYGTVPKNV